MPVTPERGRGLLGALDLGRRLRVPAQLEHHHHLAEAQPLLRNGHRVRDLGRGHGRHGPDVEIRPLPYMGGECPEDRELLVGRAVVDVDRAEEPGDEHVGVPGCEVLGGHVVTVTPRRYARVRTPGAHHAGTGRPPVRRHPRSVRDVVPVADRCELDHPHAVGKLSRHVGADLDREPGLADSAYAGQRDHAVGTYELRDLAHDVVAADDRAQLPREIAGERIDAAERREVGREPVAEQLVHRHPAPEPAQPVLAERSERGAVTEQHLGRVGDEDLAAVGDCHEPGGAVPPTADVAAVAFDGVAGVQPHADGEVDGGVVVGISCAVRCRRFGGRRECGAETITTRPGTRTSSRPSTLARMPIRVGAASASAMAPGVLVPSTCGLVDGGEEERHRALRERRGMAEPYVAGRGRPAGRRPARRPRTVTAPGMCRRPSCVVVRVGQTQGSVLVVVREPDRAHRGPGGHRGPHLRVPGGVAADPRGLSEQLPAAGTERVGEVVIRPRLGDPVVSVPPTSRTDTPVRAVAEVAGTCASPCAILSARIWAPT